MSDTRKCTCGHVASEHGANGCHKDLLYAGIMCVSIQLAQRNPELADLVLKDALDNDEYTKDLMDSTTLLLEKTLYDMLKLSQ